MIIAVAVSLTVAWYVLVVAATVRIVKATDPRTFDWGR